MGEAMQRESISSRTGLVAGLILLLLLPGLVTSYHTGIGGEQSNAGETIDDGPKKGACATMGTLITRSKLSLTMSRSDGLVAKHTP